MDKLNTMRFRAHPGGLRGWINIYRWLMPISVLVAAGMAIYSIFAMVQGDCRVAVISTENFSHSSNEYIIPYPKLTGFYTFKADLADRLFIGGAFNESWAGAVFNFLIVLYVYLAFRRLDLDEPFSPAIAAYLRRIGILWILACAVEGISRLYLKTTLQAVTHGKLSLAEDEPWRHSFFAGIIILIVAEVYRRGCHLQEDKDLTI